MSVDTDQYLQPKQEYIDRYDLLTIRQCLGVIKDYQEIYRKSLKAPKLKNLSEEEKERGTLQMMSRSLFVLKGQAYQQKEKTIREWMDEDRAKQSKFDMASEPRGITCSGCGADMHSTFKQLEDRLDRSLRVLFFFECPSCKKRKGIYDDGEEWVAKPELCLKCNAELKVTHKKKGQVITWTKKCSACGYTETEVDDFEKSHVELEKQEQADKVLLKNIGKTFACRRKRPLNISKTLRLWKLPALFMKELISSFPPKARPIVNQ